MSASVRWQRVRYAPRGAERPHPAVAGTSHSSPSQAIACASTRLRAYLFWRERRESLALLARGGGERLPLELIELRVAPPVRKVRQSQPVDGVCERRSCREDLLDELGLGGGAEGVGSGHAEELEASCTPNA